MKPQTPPRSRTNNAESLTMTPWQECMHMVRSLSSGRSNKKRKARHQRVLQEQSDQVEFVGKDGSSLYGGTIVRGFLFEYLADKPEATNRNQFCITDDDDDDFVAEEGWGWSGRVALETESEEQ